MTINNKIIKLNTPDFNIGKICRFPGRKDIFLFDVTRLEMLQTSSSYEILNRVTLKDTADIKQMDTAFFTGKSLVIADSINKKLFKLNLEFDQKGMVLISTTGDYPLKPGSIITAAAVHHNHFLLLDKGLSMIRVYDEDFKEVKTIGSRMGYVFAYEDQEKQRLGFEFPEDMALKGNHVIVADSGNKRLVVINTDKWTLEKIIKLPEFPFKILSWHDDRVAISDFDRSMMIVSLRYGFVCSEEINYPVDFFPSSFNPDQQHPLLGSETNELVELSLPEVPLETMAETADNWKVLLKIKINNKEMEEARKIAADHEELLLEYAKSTTDNYFNDRLCAYVNDTLPAAFDQNETIKKKILKLSVDFIKKYKAIPDSDDKEAANIDKENIRHNMFLKIKKYRGNLQSIADMQRAIRHYPPPAKILKELLTKRFALVKETLLTQVKEIKNNLLTFNELDMLTAIVEYWLFSEEEQVLFPDGDFKYEKLFADRFLLAILNDFYYNIAQLFLNHHKVDEYINFSDRELTMYPDKTDIARLFIDKLIALKKYDGALRMLGKFPDKNKENVNYLYFRLYRDKGDIDKAFFHLKKELELYSHRFELIPQLISLNKLKREEADAYIEKIMEKSGQSIDIYLNVAAAFQAIGDFEKTQVYIDKELEYFPENQDAIVFKLNLLLNNPHRAEMEKLVSRLTSPAHSLMRSKVYYFLGDFQKSWYHFKDFIRTNPEETLLLANLYLMGSLNDITPGEAEMPWLREMAAGPGPDACKREIFAYLSYLKHIEKKDIDIEVEKFTADVYLSATSTAKAAYNHFFKQLEQLKEHQKTGELLALVENTLRYNPGDPQVFKFLAELAETGDEPAA